jgi:hypothetical protein
MSTTLTLETVNEIGEHLRRSIAEVDMILISASERDDGRAWLEQLNRQPPQELAP